MPSLEVATGSSFCSFPRVASFCWTCQAGYGYGKQLRPTSSSRAPPPLVVAPSKKTCCFLVQSPRQVSCLCYKKLDVNEEPELEEGRLVQTTTDHQQSWGVAIALTLLSFYRREISPFLPRSCRFVPSCSEYSMQAYRKYGVLKGTILTAWRLMRCNPFGPSGYDPPRWFGESSLPDI